MADFNPAAGLIRNAWETTPGIAATTGWHDHEFLTEEMVQEYGRIDPASITNLGQQPLSLPSKIRPTGSIPVELDAESHVHYLANLQKFSATPTNPAASTYVHKLAPSETDVDFADALSIDVWRDDDQGGLFRNCRVNQVEFNLTPENLFLATIGFGVERGDYFTAATQDTGTSTDPAIRGIPKYSDWDGTDRVLWIEVTDDTLLPVSFVAKATLNNDTGTPATHGGTSFTVTIGNDALGRPIWNSVVLSDGSGRLGTRDLEVEIHMADSTGAANLDEWYFQLDRQVWVPSYPSLPKFNEIFAAVKIGTSFAGAIEYEIDQFSLTVERPAESKFAIGGRFPKRVKERGRRRVTGSLQREYLDTDLRRKLERAQTFWLVVEAFSGEEIDPGYEHSIQLISGACFLDGPTPTVGGEETMDESYNFSCHPSGDATYPDDITIVVQNSIADLTV